MKTFSKATQLPDQNDIVLVHFTDGMGPEVGKYQDGSIVLSDGKRSRSWSDVALWRCSEVVDSAPLITRDKPPA
jgi:hypothetical protein